MCQFFTVFNSFMTESLSKKKPVNWSALQINGLVSLWQRLPSWKSENLKLPLVILKDKSILLNCSVRAHFVMTLFHNYYSFYFRSVKTYRNVARFLLNNMDVVKRWTFRGISNCNSFSGRYIPKIETFWENLIFLRYLKHMSKNLLDHTVRFTLL